jgi:hypothetical protein
MFYRARAFLLSLTIIAVLVFSAVGTTAVYADGGTTPEAPSTETSSEECNSDDCAEPEDADDAEEPAGETDKPGPDTVDTIETAEPADTAPTEVPVEGEATPVPTEEVAPPVEGEATPVPTDEAAPPAEETDSTSETTPADKPAVETPILDTVPENTTVAVVNAEGELQPLATQAAADAIATSDPIWCPAGQAPTPGANGCTQSFNSFTALLTFLSGNATYTGAGTIYVEQGNYQGGESTIDFNNYNLTNISNADLTITGGWNTGTGTTTSTSTFNNVSIVIGTSTNPWGGSLTLNNLTITNPTGTGITVNSQNNIVVSNVNVTNSTNGAGAELNAGNDVTINNSKFERNKTAGAIIRAGRDVAIANSSFSNPANARRQIIGLDIIADGSVSLFNVLANENREVGATIDAGGRVSIANSGFSGTKAIKGSEFLGYGLKIVTPDAIDLAFVTANDNFLWGAWLIAGSDVAIANSIFNGNTTESPGFIDDTGLLVTSGGNVSIINSQANENRLIGATIEAVGDVSISNSQFNLNNGITLDSAGTPTFHGYGLQVITDGNIFLNGVTASNNTLFGAHLESGLNMDVSISNSTFSSNTSPTNGPLVGRGLEVISGGNVLMENVTLDNNQTFGAHIQAAGAVFLDSITATNNGTNGVEVVANCTDVFLINGTYSNNGEYGLSVLNGNLTQSGAPVFANNVAGNIFNNPGTCVFTSPTPPTTPPTTPPVYKPNDVGAVVPFIPGVSSLTKSQSFSSGSLNPAAAGMVSLNSFLANHGMAYNNTHIGVFTGKYAYVYLSSGMQIVAYSPSPANELALNGS